MAVAATDPAPGTGVGDPRPRSGTLRVSDFPELYRMLQAPVTAFDCGTLCAPSNGGVPVCCDATKIIPVLWQTELRYQRRRRGWTFWRKHEPNDEDERRMERELRPCFTLGSCPGSGGCEREKRSLNCRTFPFEPYLDHARKFRGLVFDYRFRAQCPLVGGERHRDITEEYVREACAFWREVLLRDSGERDYYWKASQEKRRSFGQLGRRVPVLTPKGVIRLPTAR